MVLSNYYFKNKNLELKKNSNHHLKSLEEFNMTTRTIIGYPYYKDICTSRPRGCFLGA
jgi:hypothetical protein